MVRESSIASRVMEAVILEAPGQLAHRRVPIPVPQAGEVLVRVQAATTCGTDLKAYLRGHPQIPMPGGLGHEYSGVVAAVGPHAPFTVGEEVMGVHSAPCQTCAWCLRDQENLCESIMSTKVLGAYAEYLLIPEHVARLNLFPKPPGLSFERAALLEPLACVAQGIDLAAPTPNQSILVIGPGAIGLMFASVLHFLGIAEVTVAGRNPARLEIAKRMGARTVELPELCESYRGAFDMVIECTGREEIWEKSLDFVTRGGKVVLFGGCPAGSTVTFDTRRVHYDQITLISPFHFGTRAVRKAREWLLDERLVLDPLLSGERRLDEAAQVFDDLREGRGIKYVFKP